MSSTLTSPPAPFSSTTVSEAGTWRTAVATRFADYLMIVKPRISVMVLLTVCAGYYLGCRGAWDGWLLINALLGVALVATGSSALNQFLERFTDARMLRTANRPLPSGRLSPREVLVLGLSTGLFGTLWLACFVNLTTASLTALTWVLYVVFYTPLKRRSALSTVVGAIPGALPPVLGWTAAGAALDSSAAALFGILFLWQFPHFLAIAWLYREEYSRAGLKMIPVAAKAPRVAGLLAVGYASVLIPISLFPAQCGLAGSHYLAVVLALGLIYVAASARFAWQETVASARGLLTVSLIYLPLVLLALVGDHWRLLS